PAPVTVASSAKRQLHEHCYLHQEETSHTYSKRVRKRRGTHFEIVSDVEVPPPGRSEIFILVLSVIGIMKNVMHSYGAFGLAAPQIGIPLQIIMVEVPAYIQKYFSSEVWKSREMELVPFTVIINPETRILNNAEVKFPEGCESLKGYSAVVPRYKEVSISGGTKQIVLLRTEQFTPSIRCSDLSLSYLSLKPDADKARQSDSRKDSKMEFSVSGTRSVRKVRWDAPVEGER
ncbi:unnamed protein product, partial [Darwinula stevensoni]